MPNDQLLGSFSSLNTSSRPAMDTSEALPPLSHSNQSSEIPTSPTLRPPSRRVSYVSSPSLTSLASQLPSNIGRSRLVHDLVRALGLLRDDDEEELEGQDGRDGEDPEGRGPSPPPRATVVAPLKVGRKDLGRFHDLDYVGQSSPSLPVRLVSLLQPLSSSLSFLRRRPPLPPNRRLPHQLSHFLTFLLLAVFLRRRVGERLFPLSKTETIQTKSNSNLQRRSQTPLPPKVRSS